MIGTIELFSLMKNGGILGKNKILISCFFYRKLLNLSNFLFYVSFCFHQLSQHPKRNLKHIFSYIKPVIPIWSWSPTIMYHKTDFSVGYCSIVNFRCLIFHFDLIIINCRRGISPMTFHCSKGTTALLMRHFFSLMTHLPRRVAIFGKIPVIETKDFNLSPFCLPKCTTLHSNKWGFLPQCSTTSKNNSSAWSSI